MLRRILVPLDPSSYGQAALGWSCYAARITSAELTGLAVLDLPGIEKSIGSVPLGGIHYARHLVEKKEIKALDYVEKLLRAFEDRCRREGVRYRLAECQGNPSKQIIRDSIYYDIVVLGLRTCFHYDCEFKQGDSIADLLDHSVTPVFAVPDHFEAPKGKVSVLVAFDGSFPAARALHRFAQLVRTAEFMITIIMSHQDMEYANDCLSQAEGFLRAHGFGNIDKVWTPRNIVDEIRNNYLQQTNMFVIGAHSKRGLKDFMVGSLSKVLIREENKYLLIGQ